MYTGSLPAQTNRDDFIFIGTVIDKTKTEVDLTDAVITVYLTDARDTDRAILTANVENGKLTYPTPTSFQFWFTPDDVQQFCDKTYRLFIKIVKGGIKSTIAALDVPFIEGGPRS